MLVRLEFGHIEYDPLALFFAPVLAITNGVHLLLLKHSQMAFFAHAIRHSACARCRQRFSATAAHPSSSAPIAFDLSTANDLLFHRFSLSYVVAVFPLLAVPALFSYAHSKVPYDASWESIDIVSGKLTEQKNENDNTHVGVAGEGVEQMPMAQILLSLPLAY